MRDVPTVVVGGMGGESFWYALTVRKVAGTMMISAMIGGP